MAPLSLAPEKAREIAKEAYIYGFPLVDSYRIQHAYFVDKTNPEYKSSWNRLHSMARVFTPDDKAVQTPNSDTPYSMLGMDLRAEPLVLSLPRIEEGRYFSVQLVDSYTHNFDYLGTRASGNGGGTYLLAGPDWRGQTPQGIDKVFRSETQFALGIFRTQLFGPDDLENVKKVQAGYRAQPLSMFLGAKSAATAPAIDWAKPLTPEGQKKSLAFFEILNFVLRFCPTAPSEVDLMRRFAMIGVGGGKPFNADNLAPEMRLAFAQGIEDAWTTFATFKKEKMDTAQVKSGDLFGTRDYLRNNYLYRMAGAVLGIFGNSQAEAMYPVYLSDSNSKPLNGQNNYRLRFAPGKLPPANAFWSMTLYSLPQSLLVANSKNRYLLNSPMLPHFTKDSDGGHTFYIQNQPPSGDKEANWLPAPTGPFMVVLRIYWPKPEALSGEWTKPPMEAV